MSDLKEYEVATEDAFVDGRYCKKGDKVMLSDADAKFSVLGGVVKLVEKSKPKAKAEAGATQKKSD